MMQMTAADFRAKLAMALDACESTHERVMILRQGHEPSIVMALSDLEALEETLEILSDPETMAALAESEEDVKAGRVLDMDEVLSQRAS